MRIEWFFLVVMAASCSRTPSPSPQPDVPTIIQDDAGLDQDAEAAKSSYDAACANLAKLGCPEADASADGKTCAARLKGYAQVGRLSVHPTCISGAKTKAELKACNVRCE